MKKIITISREFGAAGGTIGKTVDITLGDTKTTGVVEAVTYGANPQVRVNNMYYDMKQISAVYGE